jgi:hypothetical protein
MEKTPLFATISSLSWLPHRRDMLDALWHDCQETWKRTESAKRLQPAGLLSPDGTEAGHLVTLRIPFLNMGRWPFWHRKECQARRPDAVHGENVFSVGLAASALVVLAPAAFGMLWGWIGFAAGIVLGVVVRVILGDGRWGAFCPEATDADLLLNYGIPENRWPFNLIRDHVLPTAAPNVLVGRFCVVIGGKERFLGYFFLSRIKKRGV